MDHLKYPIFDSNRNEFAEEKQCCGVKGLVREIENQGGEGSLHGGVHGGRSVWHAGSHHHHE